MDNINLAYSNKVEFVLQNGTLSSMTLNKEPDGWKEDGQKIVRHKEYHGTFIQFTEALKFYGTAREYILEAFETEGINTKLYLIKKRLVEEDGDVKFKVEYIGLADFEELTDRGGFVSIRFNSNDLETIIKAHETDKFELDREDSIDGDTISELNLKRGRQVYIEGRTLVTAGESQDYKGNPEKNLAGEYRSELIKDNVFFTPRTEIVAQGHPRHSTVDVEIMDTGLSLEWPSHMFFVDDKAEGENLNINITIEIDATVWMYRPTDYMIGVLRKVEFNGNGYDVIEDIEIQRWDNQDPGEQKRRNNVLYSYQANDVNHKTGFIFFMDTYGGWDSYEMGYVDLHKYNIKVDVKSFYEPSIHDFMFVDEAMSRLMEIITGEQKKFYSKLFGRKAPINTERGGPRTKGYPYAQDGEYGLIGLTCGYWLRRFNPESEKYKSMQLSLKDLTKSLIAVFNVGITVENVNMRQRLRIEELAYFYRDEVVVELPFQVTDVERKVSKDLFFSGTEIGYEEGGDYENELGLDEPNTTTSTVTPLRRTANKFTQKSKVRSDDYGRELIRRKPEKFFPEEDTDGDDHNWFLDLKRTEGRFYNEKHWSDRLQVAPEGISDPDTYRSFLFTPLRMLLRHGWIIRAGMEQAINLGKKIKYISKNANKRLKMWFIGEPEPIAENDDIVVSTLKRSKILPWEIKFNHPVSQDLLKELLGSTPVEVNGELENVPNTYFKVRFINEEGKYETGYIMEVDPKQSGSFKLIKANENLIV